MTSATNENKTWRSDTPVRSVVNRQWRCGATATLCPRVNDLQHDELASGKLVPEGNNCALVTAESHGEDVNAGVEERGQLTTSGLPQADRSVT